MKYALLVELKYGTYADLNLRYCFAVLSSLFIANYSALHLKSLLQKEQMSGSFFVLIAFVREPYEFE